MKIDPYCQQQKCRPMTLASGDMRFMQIFEEVPREGASNDIGVATTAIFSFFRGIYFGNFRD